MDARKFKSCRLCGITYVTNRNSAGYCGTVCRFWSKVDKKGNCWIWSGKPEKYGTFSINDRSFLAHRVAYELTFGPIPDHDSYHGHVVMHECDTPGCVRPNHLRLGLTIDNAQDMIAKGRSLPQTGDLNHASKYNSDQVSLIRASGGSSYELSKQLGIPASTIRAIRNGQRRHS